MKVEIQTALIAAVTSTIITPLIQLGTDALRRKREYRLRASPIIESVRTLHYKLLQVPLDAKMEDVSESIRAIEQFSDPIFDDVKRYDIKIEFLHHAKHLEKRHKNPRPWANMEYKETRVIFSNAADRMLAVLARKKRLPELFDPNK